MGCLVSHEFYDQYTTQLDVEAEKRRKAIETVDQLILKNVPANSKILDIGCGTGLRSIRIIRSLAPVSFTAIDSSSEMVRASKERGVDAYLADIREYASENKYDVIISLWNTFGHIGSRDSVLRSLCNVACLLEKDGTFYLDLNNRENVANYGTKAIRNIALGLVNYDYHGGDFRLNTSIGGNEIMTVVHIFSRAEIARLLHEAGLIIEKVYYYNYETGKLAHTRLGGQMLLVIRKKR